jgi:hypothetical protein
MTLLDAKEYDPAKEREAKDTRIISAVVLVLVPCSFRCLVEPLPGRKNISPIRFFSAPAESKTSRPPTAFILPIRDWRQHPQNHAQYPLNEFKQDWGPGGEWGIIKSYQIYGAT